MQLPLEPDGSGRYVLPSALRDAGLQIMIVDRWVHLARAQGVGYYDPPLCGASTASRNVARKAGAPDASIPICRDCARAAGVEGA